MRLKFNKMKTRNVILILALLIVIIGCIEPVSAISVAYVTNSGGGTVSVINPATGTVTGTINVGSDPFGVAFNPAGTLAYVTNYGGTTVSVINPATGTVTGTITVGSDPIGVAFNPAGTLAYVANYGGGTVSVINPATGTVTGTITVGASPRGVAFNPAGTLAYVTNYGDNTVSVINPATGTVTGTITVGSKPFGVAFNLIPPQPPVANFTGTPTSGTVPLTVSFTDASTNTPTSWFWVFNDGSTTNNTQQNPIHTFSSVGTYQVDLESTNAYGSNWSNKTAYITVTSIPTVSFTANVTAGYVPFAVQFNDTSSFSPSSYTWSFGDGNTSTSNSPAFTYRIPGLYTVTHSASNSTQGVSGWLNVTGYIFAYGGAPTGSPLASFVGFPTNGTTPLNVKFIDSSSNNPYLGQWYYQNSSINNGANGSWIQGPNSLNPSQVFTTGNWSVIEVSTNVVGSNISTQGYIQVMPSNPSFITYIIDGIQHILQVI